LAAHPYISCAYIRPQNGLAAKKRLPILGNRQEPALLAKPPHLIEADPPPAPDAAAPRTPANAEIDRKRSRDISRSVEFRLGEQCRW